MQTLYGIRCTDRIRVEQAVNGGYRSYFDDMFAGEFPSGKAAINGALKSYYERRDAEQAAEHEALWEAQKTQEKKDQELLEKVADRIGLPVDDLEELIAVIGRRLSAED